MRKRKAEEELKQASTHIYYEIWMLNETAKIVCPDNLVINNSLIESFGIHARCILDFLCKDTGKEDDILAIDFFDDPKEWSQYIKEKSSMLDEINTRVGKELAHLTYARLKVTLEEKRWNKKKIVREINVLFKYFLEKIPKSKFCNELVQLENII